MHSRHPYTPLVRLCFLSAPFVTALYAQVAITPASPVVVPVGTTVKFRAKVPVSWSLAPGSAGSIDPDGTYHAPDSILVNNRMAGCQLLPNDHVLNTRIDSLPVHPKSKIWMSQIPAGGIGYYPAWGTNIADAESPKHPMHFAYTPQNDGSYELLAWPYLKRENGVFSDPLSDLDRHVLTVDRNSCAVFELYNNYDPGTNSSCPECTAQGGVHYSSMSSLLPFGATDAAGLFLAPLTFRLEEIRSGAIRHALRVTLKNNYISPSSVWPASVHAGAWGFIPYGTRFRLRADFDDSHFSPLARVLSTQLKEYGLVLADGGADWEIDGSTDVTEDPAVIAAMHEVSRHVASTQLEIVDESPLVSSPKSGRVKPDNGYVKPDSYAVVVATDLNNPSKVGQVSVTLQGVTVGVPDPAIWIQSGVSTKLIAWVNGASNKAVTWSISPSLGEFSPAAVYTAPSVSKPAMTTLTATSVADPNSKATVALSVLPAGAIRIDVGNATGAPGTPHHYAPDYGPDSEGHMWWREEGGEVGWGVVNDDWYAQTWPKIPDIGLYYTSRYSFGDMIYRFLVPNGKYKIGLMFAQPGCKGTYPKGWRAPIHVETQGQIVLRNIDMGLPIDYACNTPIVETIPASVSDNSLYFSLRRVTLRADTPSPLINAFYISPDSSPPHLSIDPDHLSAVLTGQHVQFQTVGWWMSNAVKWSVTGPGSISQTGVFTAPSLPPGSDENVTVEAQSTVNPAISATAKFLFKSGALVISPASVSVDRGLSQKFEATIGGSPYANVNWSITPQLGSISASGVYTAPDTPENAEVTVKAQSKDYPSKSATAKITVNAVPKPIRMNCGGFGLTDAHGNVWSHDSGYSAGTITYHNSVPIAGASPDMQGLYQSSRYRYRNQAFSYTFALPNGKYAVTLKFADYTYDNSGHYIFDVQLNGKKVLTSFDPDKVHGGKSAVDQEFDTTVTNKSLRIDLIGHNGDALINGLQIIYLGPA